MIVVRSKVTDLWRGVPHGISGDGRERILVQSREQGIWCVNGIGTIVFPGLVVGFLDENAAMFFLDTGNRAARPYVEVGTLLAFHEDRDAQHFIELGVAEKVTKEEAERDPKAAPVTRCVGLSGTSRQGLTRR